MVWNISQAVVALALLLGGASGTAILSDAGDVLSAPAADEDTNDVAARAAPPTAAELEALVAELAADRETRMEQRLDAEQHRTEVLLELVETCENSTECDVNATLLADMRSHLEDRMERIEACRENASACRHAHHGNHTAPEPPEGWENMTDEERQAVREAHQAEREAQREARIETRLARVNATLTMIEVCRNDSGCDLDADQLDTLQAQLEERQAALLDGAGDDRRGERRGHGIRRGAARPADRERGPRGDGVERGPPGADGERGPDGPAAERGPFQRVLARLGVGA